MIKLCASYGLKVPGQQEYSSESFHASAEVEMAGTGTADPHTLQNALGRLWSDLKQAVAAEMVKGSSKVTGEPAKASPAANNGHQPLNNTGHAPADGNGQPQPVNRVAAAARGEGATKKQVSFLFALGRRHKNFSADQTRQWVQAEFGKPINELSKADAAQVIDALSGNY